MRNCVPVIFIFLLCFSCKSDTEKVQSTASSMETLREIGGISNPLDSTKDPTVKMDSSLLAEFTKDLWHYRFTLQVKGGGDTSRDRGKWLSFQPDGTFHRGLFQDTINTGVFVHAPKRRTIQFKFNDSDTEDEEWRFMLKNDVMVLIGNDKDVNAGIQIKLERSTDFPIPEIQ